MDLVRYVVVAAVALLLDVLTLIAIVDYLGSPVWAAVFAGFAVGVAFNYLLSIRWVFKSRSRFGSRVEFAVFAGIGAAGIVITEIVMCIGGILGTDYRFSKGIAVCIVFAWNFLLRRVLLADR